MRFPADFLDALANRIRELEPAGHAAVVAIDGWGCGGKTHCCGEAASRSRDGTPQREPAVEAGPQGRHRGGAGAGAQDCCGRKWRLEGVLGLA